MSTRPAAADTFSPHVAMRTTALECVSQQIRNRREKHLPIRFNREIFRHRHHGKGASAVSRFQLCRDLHFGDERVEHDAPGTGSAS
jgi:hypothetical protein